MMLNKGAMKFSRTIDDQPLHDVDSKVPGLNLLVNDRKRLSHSSDWLPVYLPVSMVAELELDSVKPSPDTIEEVQTALAILAFKA